MKLIILKILEIIFVAVVPVVLISINYISWNPEATALKISLGGIFLLLLVFYIFKKTVLNKYLRRISDMITQHKADLKVETNAEKITALKNALKFEKTIECIINFIIPALLLAAVFIICIALEAAVAKMSGTVGLIIVSECIGLVFSIFVARSE